MSKFQKFVVGLAVIVALAVMGATVPYAFGSATNPICSTKVYDNTKVLGHGVERRDVEQMVDNFDQAGADAHVITVAGGASLEAHVRTDCRAQWQDGKGHLRRNLLVFALNTSNHDVNLLVGERWTVALEQSGAYRRFVSQFPAPQYSGRKLGTFFGTRINEVYTAIVASKTQTQ